jgi:hypothetical protein
VREVGDETIRYRYCSSEGPRLAAAIGNTGPCGLLGGAPNILIWLGSA